MTLLVLQEQHFIKLPNGQIWVKETSNTSFWDRYLDVFDQVIVCARLSHHYNNVTDGLMRSDRPEVIFIGLPDFRGILGLLSNWWQIRKTISMVIDKADCIIYRAPSPISLIAYPIIKKKGKPFAIELMNNPLTTYSKQTSRNVLIPLIRKIVTNQTREMCLVANGVSYVTENSLQKLYPCTALLQHISNKHYFTSYYSTIRLEEENYFFNEYVDLTRLPNPIILVHSGKMNDLRKGQNLMINCAKSLIDRGYNIRLKLMGDGILKNSFINLARKLDIDESVDFLGWITGYEAVQKILQEAHLFIFPTLGEGLPRSVIEAMANGVLPIASDIDGVGELLPKELLVSEFSTEAFEEKIISVLDNWSQINEKRNLVFQKSKEYAYSILREKRTTFYKSLYDCCILD